MLRSEHSIVEFKGGLAIPDRLTREVHRHYLNYTERMLAIYRNGIGRQRRECHREVELLFADEPDCPTQRIQAFCKLLDEKSVFQADPRGEAGKLRMRVFTAAAQFHPLVGRPDRLFEYGETETKARIARQLGMSWSRIEGGLYADVMSFQRLESFTGYDGAAALLSRYNVAQVQACLYRAESMVITATNDFKTILRYVKLARLLHEIYRLGPSKYRIVLTGPASVLRRSRRYGVNFARFLPALLTCKGWNITAVVATPWNTKATLKLSDRDGFTSHLPPTDEFDSHLEESFAKKFGRQRDGWRLVREGEILYCRQTAFVPDFIFRHEDGTAVLLEIVGFWTPEYLAKKRQTLRLFRDHKILIAVPERSLREGASVGDDVIVYKTALKLKPVIEALERVRRLGR